MIVCHILIISLLAYFTSMYMESKGMSRPDIDNAKKRYSRSANTPILPITEKLYERKSISADSAKVIAISEKFK